MATERRHLAEDQDDILIAGALADGYVTTTTVTIVNAILGEIVTVRGSAPSDVIDIGGGEGDFFDALNPIIRSYVNVDPGQYPLTAPMIARSTDPRFAILKTSAESIDRPDASADVVLSLAAWDHIPHADRALAEVERLLRPGGVFVVALNNRGSWWKRLVRYTPYWRRRSAFIAQFHFVQWTLAELKAHVGRRLTVTKAYSVVFCPHITHVWPSALPALNAVGNRLLPRLGGVSIVVARKATADT